MAYEDEVIISTGNITNHPLLVSLNPLEMDNPEPYTLPYYRQGECFGNYLWQLGQIVHCPIPYDRTDKKRNMLNVHIDPIPKVEIGWNKTLEECFLERAREIWAMEKPVRLWWSGGIDSTSALTAFLLTKRKEDRLIVYMNNVAIEENPSFWNNRIKTNNDVTIQESDQSNIFSIDNFSDGSINVTGEPGDMVYGSFVVEHHVDELDQHWHKMLEWEDCNFNCDNIPEFMEYAEEFVLRAPFEIRTAFDFTWWLAFSVKWQWIVQRFCPQLEDPSLWYDNILGFYNCPEIQKWSIVNHDMKHKGTWESYKFPAKDFIYNYNKDISYRDHKTKKKSIFGIFKSEEARFKFRDKALGRIEGPSLIMKSGEWFSRDDPNQALLDKWDVFTEPLWKEWKKLT